MKTDDKRISQRHLTCQLCFSFRAYRQARSNLTQFTVVSSDHNLRRPQSFSKCHEKNNQKNNSHSCSSCTFSSVLFCVPQILVTVCFWRACQRKKRWTSTTRVPRAKTHPSKQRGFSVTLITSISAWDREKRNANLIFARSCLGSGFRGSCNTKNNYRPELSSVFYTERN